MSRFVRLLFFLLLVSVEMALSAQAPPASRPFGVRDSIELNYFSLGLRDGGQGAILSSPDGGTFVFVTSRGSLAKNTVVSSVWEVRADELKHSLELTPSKGLPPIRVRLLARIEAVPRKQAYDPHSAVVSHLKWAPNSRHLYFLAQRDDGTDRLLEVDLQTRALRDISRPRQDVRHYDLANEWIAYASTPRHLRLSLEGEELPHSISGMTLADVLYPQSHGSYGRNFSLPEIWVGRRANEMRRMPRPSQSDGRPDAEHDSDLFSLSPDGRWIVSLSPVISVPPEWSLYEPVQGHEDRNIVPSNPNATAPANRWHLRRYTLTDVQTGITTRLVDAPLGDSLGSSDAIRAVWSGDGKELLVTNTTMPLNVEDPIRNVCTVASIDVASRVPICVVQNRSGMPSTKSLLPTPRLRLTGLEFGSTADAIKLYLTANGENSVETYRRSGNHWALNGGGASSGGKSGDDRSQQPISLELRQTSDSLPALWAVDRYMRTQRKIVDPNPGWKTSDFAKSMPFNWRDRTNWLWKGVLISPLYYVPGQTYPLVIQTHGTNPNEFLIDGKYPTAEAARALSSQGFFVLQMPYRNDHVGTPMEASDQLEGYESGLASLAHEYPIDLKRIGIVGFSRTGFHVEEALIQRPDLFAAAVIADGTDTSYMPYRLFSYRDTFVADDIERLIGGKPFGDGLKLWQSHASGFRLDHVQTPVLVQALGPMSLLMEWELFSTLQQTGNQGDLLYIPTGQHVLQKPKDLYASQKATVDWFCRWLGMSQNGPRP